MIDWIKFRIVGESSRLFYLQLINDESIRVDARTGEVMTTIFKLNSAFKITIRPNKYITVEGSIHKYYDGFNYSQFTFKNLKNAISNLCSEINVLPKDCKIYKMEVGLNLINPILSFTTIYNNLLTFHGESFEPFKFRKKHFGLICKLQNYDLKIYSKSLFLYNKKI